MTYSTKAQKHKEIYPYLRYGLVVGGINKITNKFFIHNIGFDFAIALEKTNKDTIEELIKIVKCQIKNAESILGIFKYKNQTKSFNTQITIKKLNERSNQDFRANMFPTSRSHFFGLYNNKGI